MLSEQGELKKAKKCLDKQQVTLRESAGKTHHSTLDHTNTQKCSEHHKNLLKYVDKDWDVPDRILVGGES